MNENSQQVELIKQSVPHIEKDSLMLTLNYLYENNWLHSHSIGYAGSGKQIPTLRIMKQESEMVSNNLEYKRVLWPFSNKCMGNR